MTHSRVPSRLYLPTQCHAIPQLAIRAMRELEYMCMNYNNHGLSLGGIDMEGCWVTGLSGLEGGSPWRNT